MSYGPLSSAPLVVDCIYLGRTFREMPINPFIISYILVLLVLLICMYRVWRRWCILEPISTQVSVLQFVACCGP